MGLNTKKILGISVTTSSKKTILEYIEKYLGKSSVVSRQSSEKPKKLLVIVTPNTEQIVYAQTDRHFVKLLNEADIAIPDGIGISLAAKFLGSRGQGIKESRIVQRIPGVELMEDLVKIAAKEAYSIGLIGGRTGVAVKALECLQAKHPGLDGWVDELGEVQIANLGDLRPVVEKIRSTRTRFVFVGLGAPKQEYFIEELVRYSLLVHRKTGNVHNDQPTNKLTNHSLVLMSVGGSFDILSGTIVRAPQAIQAIGLEWLWRLIREPWRFRRQFALLKFLWLIIREKLASQGIALRS